MKQNRMTTDRKRSLLEAFELTLTDDLDINLVGYERESKSKMLKTGGV